MEVYEELVPEIKNLLRNNAHKLKISGKIKRKIEKIHGILINDVLSHLNDPKDLTAVEIGVSRRAYDKTYHLMFQKDKKYHIFVAIIHRTLKNDLFLVTAYKSSKEYERLLKNYKR